MTPLGSSGVRVWTAAPQLSRVALAGLLVAGVALSGCRDREVVTYRTPKERDVATPTAAVAPAASGELPPGHPPLDAGLPSAAGSGGMAGGAAMATAQGAGLEWTAPAHWTPTAGSAMRKGSFSVTGEGGAADLAITAFPGDVGGELANVNRWRGQLQLPPIGPGELEGALTRFESHGLKFALVDLASPGATPTRMLGAAVPFDGATWFFKLTGPEALVAGEKPAFLEFLRTVKPRTAAATP